MLEWSRGLAIACLFHFLVSPATTQQATSSSPAPQYDFAPVRTFIRKTISDKQLPSVSVAVAQRGRIIWEEAFGWADREKLIPSTPDTMYALGASHRHSRRRFRRNRETGPLPHFWPAHSLP
jgi:CubicO group peptidase (beta-lactamase class C family)